MIGVEIDGIANTTWDDWRSTHPQTEVLSTDTGFPHSYKRSPYGGYEKTKRLMFKVTNRAPRDYHPKSMVLGVEVDGTFKAYPFDELSLQGDSILEDEVAGKVLTIHWDTSATSARAVSANGKELPTVMLYWFAWYAFHPETLIFKAPS